MRSTQQIDDIDRSIIRLEQLRVIAGNTDVDSIKSAAASLPEVIELFTVAGDPDALAQAVVGLIGNAPARRAMGRAAQKRARATFSADAIVPHYEALYRRVCAAS